MSRRFLALLVMVCLLMSMAVVGHGAAADGNLFEDGSFEAVGIEGFKDYTSGWDFYWFAPLSNDGTMESQSEFVIHDAAQAHDGEYYIRNDKTGWFGIAEPSVELAQGSYIFSTWVKAVEGTLKVNFTVDEGPGGCVIETDTLGTSLEIPEGEEWVQLKMRFTIEQAGTYRVRLGMNSINQEVVEYFFDDFSLTATTGDEDLEIGKIYEAQREGGNSSDGGSTSVEGDLTVELSAATDKISNQELTTTDGMEKNKSYLTLVVKDADGNELSLKELYRAEALSWESSDANVAIVKGNYKSYYIYGIAPGEATLTLKVTYNNTVTTASVDIQVEGSVLKDGGFEGSTDGATSAYWTVVVGKDAKDGYSWGYDVNSTFNMTGGNNLFIRMPNGGYEATDGTVLVYQDVELSAEKYNFAAYIRRFPGFEQQDTVDGYDSFNTPVTVGAVLLDADGNETDTRWSETYKDDYKMGVGDFEACSVAFEVTEAGTYRLYLLAESEIHVGMGMQVDNMCLTSGKQIDRIEASFGTDNTVKVGSGEPLSLKAYYADGTEVELGDVRPSYSSSDMEVLTITSDNMAYGMAAGTAKVYASITVNGVEYKCTIEATVEGDAPAATDPVGTDAPENDTDATMWIVVGVVFVVAAVAVVVMVIVRKKKVS